MRDTKDIRQLLQRHVAVAIAIDVRPELIERRLWRSTAHAAGAASAAGASAAGSSGGRRAGGSAEEDGLVLGAHLGLRDHARVVGVQAVHHLAQAPGRLLISPPLPGLQPHEPRHRHGRDARE